MQDTKFDMTTSEDAAIVKEPHTERRPLLKIADEEAPIKTSNAWSSEMGVVFACLGCCVGTGNLWRFPRVVATNSSEHGCLAFLIVWLFFLPLWSIPVQIIEYSVGRYTKKATIQCFIAMIGPYALWCGLWVTIVTFGISCYYSVVLGWCFYYTYYTIAHELPSSHKESQIVFEEYADDSYWPVLTTFIACVVCCLAVARGVKSIEKVTTVLMPVLLCLLIFTFYWSLTLPLSNVGIELLFSPDWDRLANPRTWVDAISQNAFDTSAGMGLLVPYAAFMTRRNGIVRYATLLPSINNTISLICGITIYATVFSTTRISFPELSTAEVVDILKQSGPGGTGITFIWMPVLFATLGGVGRAFCVVFFLCLCFAAVTSLISNVELVAHNIADFGVPRSISVFVTGIILFIFGLPSSLSLDFLAMQDFVWGFGLVVNGLMFLSMVLIYGVGTYRRLIINEYGLNDWHLPIIWQGLIYFCVLEAVALLAWWAYDRISAESAHGEAWYDFGLETFATTMAHWLTFLVGFAVLSVILVRKRPAAFVRFLERAEQRLVV